VTSPGPVVLVGRLGRIRARLRGAYGPVLLSPHGRPLDELVLTLLSQSTSDSNRDVAFGRLRARFGSWSAVRDAPIGEVEEALRPGGIAKVKSARLRAILRALGDPPSLDHLAALPVEEARAALVAFPGVGRKTAACVLLFSFGMRDVPVDTHVGRVGARLGLLPARGTPDALHDAMLAITPRGAELELHVNLLRHGRRLCHARGPECPVCPLRRICPSAVLARP
jgi:endonuclease-3